MILESIQGSLDVLFYHALVRLARICARRVDQGAARIAEPFVQIQEQSQIGSSRLIRHERRAQLELHLGIELPGIDEVGAIIGPSYPDTDSVHLRVRLDKGSIVGR